MLATTRYITASNALPTIAVANQQIKGKKNEESDLITSFIFSSIRHKAPFALLVPTVLVNPVDTALNPTSRKIFYDLNLVLNIK